MFDISKTFTKKINCEVTKRERIVFTCWNIWHKLYSHKIDGYWFVPSTLCLKDFWTNHFVGPNRFWGPIFFGPKIFSSWDFFDAKLFQNSFLIQKFFDPKLYLNQTFNRPFFGHNMFRPTNLFGHKFVLTKKFFALNSFFDKIL